MTVNRFCSSGLQAIAIAAQRIIVRRRAGHGRGRGRIDQPRAERAPEPHRAPTRGVLEHKPEIYMSMIDTAEIVSKRYNVTRETQDEYALPEPAAHRGGAARGPARRRDRRRCKTTKRRRQGDQARSTRGSRSRSTKDEGNRADTDAAGLAALKPVRGGGQRSPPATPASSPTAPPRACVMDAKLAEQRGLQPLGIFRGLRRGRLRAGRDGHRPGLRGAAAARAPRAQGRTTSTCGS